MTLGTSQLKHMTVTIFQRSLPSFVVGQQVRCQVTFSLLWQVLSMSDGWVSEKSLKVALKQTEKFDITYISACIWHYWNINGKFLRFRKWGAADYNLVLFKRFFNLLWLPPYQARYSLRCLGILTSASWGNIFPIPWSSCLSSKTSNSYFVIAERSIFNFRLYLVYKRR